MSEGKPSEYEHIIYCDRTDRPAVVYSDQKVVELVRLHTKMDELPSDALELETGKDHQLYYTFSYIIEVTY